MSAELDAEFEAMIRAGQAAIDGTRPAPAKKEIRDA